MRIEWDESDELGLAGFTAKHMLTAGCTADEGIRVLRKALVVHSLQLQHGNISRTAEQLGRHRNTIMRELAEFGIADLPRRIRRSDRQAVLQFRRKLQAVEERRSIA